MRHETTATWIVATALLIATASAQPPMKLTPAWIQSDARRQITGLPDAHWLPDGTLLIHETRQTHPGFSILDPSSGERTPALDERKALMRLGSYSKRTLDILPAPAAYANSGERVLYVMGGDLFVLEMSTARVTRVTETPEPEWAAQFSPDGKKLAFVRANDLYVHDLEGGETRRLTRDGSATILNGTLSWVYWEEIFGRRDIGYWWSHDSSSIAFLRTDESMVTEMTYVDFLPETPAVIKQRYPKAGTTNPVVRVGVAKVTEPGGTTWIGPTEESYEYVCRIQWLPGDRELAIQTMNRQQTELVLWFADGRTGKARRVLEEKDAAWVNINDDLTFLGDGKHFLWVSERTGYAHIYRYTLDGKLVNAVTRGPWALRAANPVFWVRQAIQAVDEKTGHVYFSALKDSSLEKHLYRVGLDGSGLIRISKEAGTWSFLFSEDAARYVGTHSDLRTPPALSLHTSDGRRIMELAGARTDLTKDLGLAHPQMLTIKADDGFPMPAMLYRPAEFDLRRKHPVILHVYGGPSAPMVSNAWQGWIYFNTILTQMGYVVMNVDNRSATAISKTLENTILGQMSGDHELADVRSAVAWIKRQGWADPDRVGIWGWSNGGMMTLLGMTRTKEFKAGISVAPVTNWRYYDTKWGETVNKLPKDNPKGYENTDLTKRAKDLHGRLLLVHGTYDDNVHIQNTWHFADELISAGKLFELMIYPMRMHGISDDPARRHVLETMLSFWKRNL